MKTALMLALMFGAIALLVEGLFAEKLWPLIAAPMVFIGAALVWHLSNRASRDRPNHFGERPPRR